MEYRETCIGLRPEYQKGRQAQKIYRNKKIYAVFYLWVDRSLFIYNVPIQFTAFRCNQGDYSTKNVPEALRALSLILKKHQIANLKSIACQAYTTRH